MLLGAADGGCLNEKKRKEYFIVEMKLSAGSRVSEGNPNGLPV